MTHSCKFKNFCSEVFENGCNVYGCLGSNAHFVLGVVLQESLDTTAGELEKRVVSDCSILNVVRRMKHGTEELSKVLSDNIISSSHGSNLLIFESRRMSYENRPPARSKQIIPMESFALLHL